MSVPYRNIRRAFDALYQGQISPNQLDDSHKINRLLAHATSSQLSRLNLALGAGKNPFASHGAERLYTKFLQVLADGFDNYTHSTSYSSNTLSQSKQTHLAAIRQQTVPAGSGCFFYNSFLAYSNPAEIKLVKTAWEYCKELINWGIIVAGHAGSRTACANLFRRVFGDPAIHHHVIVQNLRAVQDHMQGGATYIVNRGPTANCGNYKETDGNASGFFAVTPKDNNVAWALSDHAKHVVALCQPFFRDGVAMRTEPHSMDNQKLGFTFGGALLHELTHNVLNTADVDAADEVYEHLEKPLPQGQRAKCYGTRGCRALAAVDANSARNNADSYRVFCEDAAYFKIVR